MRCRVDPEALEALVRYDWPGNVRELANVLERAQILAEDHLITLDDLPETLAGAVPRCSGDEADPHCLSEVERRHVLRRCARRRATRSTPPRPWASAAAPCTA